jgi:DNA-binding transcriptional MocR family regulator
MNEKQGWISLHRKILLANHEPKEFMWNDSIIMVKKGQLITGRNSLAKQTGIKPSTVERILKLLENEHQIEQQKTTKYRLITIVNWKEHQEKDNKRNSKRTASGQQADTNNNDNNVNNDNKDIAEETSAPFSLKDEIKKLEDSVRRDMNVIALYFEERKPDLQTKDQYQIALKRHLRAAKQLVPFTDNQILNGVKKAKFQTPEWTLETVVKMLTK